MTQDAFDYIKVTMMCIDAISRLSDDEESLTMIDEERANCGIMSPITELNDIMKANKKILIYIDSIKDKQRIITPAQLSKELGISEVFIENILIANGFEED